MRLITTVKTLAAVGIAATALAVAVPANAAPQRAAAPATTIQPVLASSVSTASSCSGKLRFHTNHNHESITFLYRKNGCIGKVETVTYAAVLPPGVYVNPQVHIYSKGKLVWSWYLGEPGNPICVHATTTVTLRVGKKWANPVGVFGRAPVCGGTGELGPAGGTVNG